ncbi:hypothetical protein [Porphyromonas sp. HMSC065F10]|uniref:hypothetical protein n=1 Tax=Porphyromonas sp. HMSC065F10 TaxID=1739394 RepID=UPI0008A54885|nr:hypothetical protein [Porphyromonas sp. HMSC065F10]OFR38946.1 hypothetical protein HMPREF2890_02320 [Porphyromonas sp. HMSC065F10]
MSVMRIGVGSVTLLLLLAGSLSCSDSKQQSEEKSWEEATPAPLATEQSVPEATEVEEPCTFAVYRANNSLLESIDAPCNQGAEPLTSFLASFRKDSGVVRARALLPSGITPPHVVEDPFRIISPDSTGYFASWITIKRDTASFCTGYIDSDILEQYTFARKSPDDKWYLIDYYNAATQDDISEYAD